MAVVTNLFHATSGLGEFLKSRLPGVSVVLGPPPDTLLTTEEVRVTLLYVVEQGAHRNDGFERQADGTSTAPPLSLSLFYMMTAYGEAPNHDAAGAHRLLGEVARALHDHPVIDLGTFGGLGEGRLDTALVPMTPELMEKLFSPLQVKHRPFLLYEVWPVQIRSSLPTTAVGAVVAPSGLRLRGPTLRNPPVITRVVPQRAAVGAFIRVDGAFGGAVDGVTVGNTVFRAVDGDVVAVEPSTPERGVRLQLSAARIAPGVHPVTLSSGGLTSDAVTIEVCPSGAWTLDGPPTFSHSQSGGALVLSGQGLASVDAVLFWPDSGVRDPSDVVAFPVAAPTATSLQVIPSGLRPGPYRAAARVDLGGGQPTQFTSFIVLELEA